MGIADKINVDKLGAVADEVTKAVDVQEVAKSAVKDGKVDVKAAAEVVKKEVTAEEAKSIAGAVQDVFKKN